MPVQRRGPSVGDYVIAVREQPMMERVERFIAEVSPGQAWAIEIEDDVHAIVEWNRELEVFVVTREWCPL